MRRAESHLLEVLRHSCEVLGVDFCVFGPIKKTRRYLEEDYFNLLAFFLLSHTFIYSLDVD